MIRFLLVFLLALAISVSPARAKSGNLHGFVTGKHTVNVKVEQFTVARGSEEINGAEITEIFKNKLRERVSVTFNIVETAEEADLVISGDVVEFVYLEDDPIDILLPIGLVVDLAARQNYARMIFDIQVHNTTKGKIVWKKRLKSTLTKSDMPRDASVPIIMERAGKVFIRNCFGKPKN